MESDYEISFLSVGHGDATLICLTVKKHAVLIDAASHGPVLTAVASGPLELKAIFVTHLDKDHIAGLPAVISYLRSTKKTNILLFMNRQHAETKIVERFCRALDEAREDGTIKLEMAYKEYPGHVDLIGGSFVILWPTHENAILNDKDNNNDSLILRFEINKMRLLLGGDAEGIIWPQIESHDLKAKILRFPHHGGRLYSSKESWSSDKLIVEVDPEYVVLSVPSNSRHHPSEEFITAMKNHPNRHFLFTSEGNISMQAESKSGDIILSSMLEK